MDKNPKKEKKKRVKFALCSSVDVLDSSSAAPEDSDKPPSSSSSSSSGKRRFHGLRRFFGRMLSFCHMSASSEQDKTSSIQTQKTSDQEKEAVGAVVVDGSSSPADVRSSEQKPSELPTVIQETETITDVRSSEQKPSELPTVIQETEPITGNTCYMNSVIQCLLSVSPFREDLLSQQENHKDDAKLLRALTDLHMSRMDGSDSDLKETHLAKDAHEFLMACLSCLKEESMTLKSSHPSYTCPVSSMEFKLKSERTCNSCGVKKSFAEESNCLSLVIGPHASLTDSLHQYMNAPFVDCVCSLCGGPQASETLKFLTLPRVLVVLVQRFDFTSSMIKLKNRLEIPEELTLSCVKGHYISQIRECSEDGWLRCSDASVRRSSWTEVSEDVGANGYLLFYVKS
ncbi:ubiquitin carboxyl-terminal hydrolase 37-like [Sinocyclocheilus rhinocerous]|uniref:ubiquitin carboxyl-terminal hydrolase 37-like n=1 Tax=Sinocyclocheilus rhinocerous TaxID=307959 RepID=UPI0007B7EE8A|nr:PREDICTED: ubiquitin carboxyl-terminal hydrolase 37-like [Sinocyclocheilus rhinocerous]